MSVITDAIVSMYRHDAAHRSLANLPELLKGRMESSVEGLEARIKPWLKGGEYGWLISAAKDQLS